MRLIRVLWALCLASTIAIFPIAAPHAHAQAVSGHQHTVPAQGAPVHEATIGGHADGTHHAVAHADGHSQHHKNTNGDLPPCCGTIACHAFLAGVTPDLRISRISVRIASTFVEERADGLVPTSLDRPPRTA